MKLTAGQEKLIADYLNALSAELTPLGEDARRSALMRARARIREELRAFGTEFVGNGDVSQILDQCGTPSGYAERLVQGLKTDGTSGAPKANGRGVSPDGPWSLDAAEGRFLGVCAGIAREFDLTPSAVRGFGLLLLVTGPFAVLAYLGAYAYMRRQTDPDRAAPIDWTAFAKRTGAAFAIALALHLAGVWTVFAIGWAYERLTGGSIAAIAPEYGWLPGAAFGYLFWALMWSLPFAALAGLPVSKGWTGTFNKLAQACLALYAVALAYGVGALLAGVALVESKNLQGIDPAAILSQYLYP